MGLHVGKRAHSMTAATILAAALVGWAACAPAAGQTAASAPASRPGGWEAGWHAPPGARIVEEGWFPPRQRGFQPPGLPDRITRAFIIPVHGPITDTTYEVVKAKAVRCIAGGAEIVIFDMDTPGGSSAAMDDIVRLITDDLAGVYTVAFVHPYAYSAGAVISLACDEIVYTPMGVMGAAMPIMIGSGGQLVEIPDKERGKFESAARAAIRALANRNGYDPLLCEAMVSSALVPWLVRRGDTGELRIVEASDWRNKVRNAPDANTPAGADRKWDYVASVEKNALKNDLITFTADEAARWGFTRHVVKGLAGLRDVYHIAAEPTTLADNWSESLVRFLTSPAVSSVLLFVGILGVYLELQTPGVGLPGLAALIAFALLFGSRYLTGLAQWWEIALFAVGLVLLFIELFVTPGFGVLGIAGIVCCLVGLVAIVVPNAPDKLPLPSGELAWSMFQTGLLSISLGFLAAVVAAVLAAHWLPKVPVAGRLVLQAPAPAGQDAAPADGIGPGSTGVVEGTCRPVGLVRFGERLVSGVADGEFLPPGTKVKVIRRQGNRVVVEKA